MRHFFLHLLILMVLAACGKAPGVTEDSKFDDAFPATGNVKSLVVSSGEEKATRFEQESFVSIPHEVEIIQGEQTQEKLRIYFDYSDLTRDFAYFCDYSQEMDQRKFLFDACYYNEDEPTSSSYYPGYEEIVREGNHLVVKMVDSAYGDKTQAKLNIQFQLD